MVVRGCVRCGKAVTEHAKFCTHCGYGPLRRVSTRSPLNRASRIAAVVLGIVTSSGLFLYGLFLFGRLIASDDENVDFGQFLASLLVVVGPIFAIFGGILGRKLHDRIERFFGQRR